jgi:hypothetical protein
VDEIKLFEELQPPPPPDALRMRAAARARLTAATSAQLAHPPRRRGTVLAIVGAATLVAAGTGYGLAATQAGSVRPGGSRFLPTTAAGLTAVQGCPGKYITAGTLKQVRGRQLIIQPANDTDHVNRVWRAQPVTVATNASTAITVPATGTVSDITDGSRVMVQGAWTGRRLAATQVAIQAGLPPAGSFGPRFPRHPGHVRKIGPPKGMPGPPFTTGTVEDAHDGGFTLVARNPLQGVQRVHVITSSATKVLGYTRTSLSQLRLGADVVAVGPIGHDDLLTASTVTEPSGGQIMLAGGPVKIRSSGCSAAAITTAAILASG